MACNCALVKLNVLFPVKQGRITGSCKQKENESIVLMCSSACISALVGCSLLTKAVHTFLKTIKNKNNECTVFKVE